MSDSLKELILMAHVLFGMLCLVGAVWVFVETLQGAAASQARIQTAARVTAAAMWAAFLVAGYWYVVFYKEDKNVILKGPWPFAHSFVMETKEHLVILLLMLATYLPIVAANNLAASRDARRVVLWVAGLTATLALLMDGEGAIIAMGVKMALMFK